MRASRWQESIVRIFCIEPRLDGVPIHANIVLRKWQLLARGDAKLQFDKIKPGNGFCYRVLDLQAGVHFHEIKIAPADDKLHCSGIRVADRTRRLDGSLSHRRAHGRIHARRRRFLNHLLVPALQRAIALVQMHDIAVTIGHDLDFDVARGSNKFFNQDPVIAEC